MIQDQKPRYYSIIYYENDYVKPFELDAARQIRLPDGNVFHVRVLENLEQYVGCTDLYEVISANISCRLLETVQKDLQSRIAELVSEKLNRYKL